MTISLKRSGLGLKEMVRDASPWAWVLMWCSVRVELLYVV